VGKVDRRSCASRAEPTLAEITAGWQRLTSPDNREKLQNAAARTFAHAGLITTGVALLFLGKDKKDTGQTMPALSHKVIDEPAKALSGAGMIIAGVYGQIKLHDELLGKRGRLNVEQCR
jgi:hypothetical protein